MKILFIAPIPPPISGQSKASLAVLEAIKKENEVCIIDFNKNDLKNGISSFSRIFEVLMVLFRIFKSNKNKDLIYLSLSESKAGNIKDLFTYLLCYKRLSNCLIHMLGGAGMKTILEKNDIISKINKFFLKKIGHIIVEGKLNNDMFSKYVDEKKISIIPNFADDYLFVSSEEINQKFKNNNILKVLYLSNLINGKGYNELTEGYILLEDNLKKKIEISFVGGFESNSLKTNFLEKIKPYSNINYLGNFIDGEEKRKLYNKTHIFCLPTYYPFEGQPISILEAYSTGCFVITTNHSGIPYIFQNDINGLAVETKSSISIAHTLKKCIMNLERIQTIALHNNEMAELKYRKSIFQKSVLETLKKIKIA